MILSKFDSNNVWYYSPDHGQICQVIEAQTLWGETTCRVWGCPIATLCRVEGNRHEQLA